MASDSTSGCRKSPTLFLPSSCARGDSPDPPHAGQESTWVPVVVMVIVLPPPHRQHLAICFTLPWYLKQSTCVSYPCSSAFGSAMVPVVEAAAGWRALHRSASVTPRNAPNEVVVCHQLSCESSFQSHHLGTSSLSQRSSGASHSLAGPPVTFHGLADKKSRRGGTPLAASTTSAYLLTGPRGRAGLPFI